MAEIVTAAQAERGANGERHLARGEALSMRMWDKEPPGADKPAASRDYETVGYVISGRAELVVDGRTSALEPGTSWVVPKGAEHTYRILEAFTAVEANSPPTDR